MHEMRQRRPQPPQQERYAYGHPQLLNPAGQQNRLDARRNELRMARDRREAQTLAEGGQCPEELRHVRFVTGTPPAEYVRVDDDERVAHAAASLYASTVSRADSSHEKSRARSSPSWRSASRLAIACSIPAAIAAASRGSTSTAAPPPTSAVAPPVDVTTAVPHAIASSTGMPNPS